MVNLDLPRINLCSPYTVTASVDGQRFMFVTDFGVSYSVSFLPDDILLDNDAYQFVLANTNNKKSPRDPKLRKAVLAIVYAFFENSSNTLLYLCETADEKQSMRNRLFEFWFNSSPRKSEFFFVSADVKDADGILNYAAIILRLDNPKLESIVSKFTETAKILSTKPE